MPIQGETTNTQQQLRTFFLSFLFRCYFWCASSMPKTFYWRRIPFIYKLLLYSVDTEFTASNRTKLTQNIELFMWTGSVVCRHSQRWLRHNVIITIKHKNRSFLHRIAAWLWFDFENGSATSPNHTHNTQSDYKWFGFVNLFIFFTISIPAIRHIENVHSYA